MWPWSESCVNGGSTQHLLHHGLQRLKEKSLYRPLSFIKGHRSSADLRAASINFHTLVFVVYTRIYHYLQWKVVTYGATVLQEHDLKFLRKHRHLPLSLPFCFFFKLSLSIEIMLSFRKLIYSIHWFCLQEKTNFPGFLNGGPVAVKLSIWRVFICAAISPGKPQVGV